MVSLIKVTLCIFSWGLQMVTTHYIACALLAAFNCCKIIALRGKTLLTVHESMDLVYWREPLWTLRPCWVYEAKFSTSQKRWGDDVQNGEALFRLTLSELPTNRERDGHQCCWILLPLKPATEHVLLAVLAIDVEHRKWFTGTNCEIFQLQLCVACEREGQAWIQAHRPQTYHFLHWAVGHVLWNHLKNAWEKVSLLVSCAAEFSSRMRICSEQTCVSNWQLKRLIVFNIFAANGE